MNSLATTDHKRLVEIQSEMLLLLDEAKKLVRKGNHGHTTEVMDAYWAKQIRNSICSNAHGPSMQDAIDMLMPNENEDSEE
jgi:hypothetical protein